MSLLTSWLRLGSPKTKMDPCPCASHDSLAIVEKADILRDQLADSTRKQVQWLVQRIVETHAELLRLPHLRPGKVINQLLGNLVSVCSDIYDQEVVDKVLSNPSVKAILPSLRHICAQAESCLELHWAEHVLTAAQGGGGPDEVQARLRTFPYYENYQELTRLELCAILSATKTAPRRIAFIGSGPLPLTSLCLLQALKQQQQQDALLGPALLSPPPSPSLDGPRKPNNNKQGPVILNVDCDSTAIAASLSLSLALGEAGRGMEFMCAEAEAGPGPEPDASTSSPPLTPSSTTTTAAAAAAAAGAEEDLAEFDVVYLAALVGLSRADKERIVLAVAGRMRPGALLVARSAWGLRTCLYPEVDLAATPALRRRLECCVVVHPYGQVVNSVIVARVRG
ncbi:Nicotianamine synthase [Thermothelomyces heterothallicus CBS 203.75]